MKQITLGKKKVRVVYCSEAISWEIDGKSGAYYEVDIVCEELGKRPLQITSDAPLKLGEAEVNLIVQNSPKQLKIKVRKDVK